MLLQFLSCVFSRSAIIQRVRRSCQNRRTSAFAKSTGICAQRNKNSSNKPANNLRVMRAINLACAHKMATNKVWGRDKSFEDNHYIGYWLLCYNAVLRNVRDRKSWRDLPCSRQPPITQTCQRRSMADAGFLIQDPARDLLIYSEPRTHGQRSLNSIMWPHTRYGLTKSICV